MAYLIGMAQGCFLSFALWRLQGGARFANRFLAAFLLALSISMGDSFLYTSGLMLRFPGLVEVLFVFAFTLGPLLYLYTQAVTSAGFHLSARRHAWHFAPFLLCVVYYLPLFGATNEAKAALISGPATSLTTPYYPVQVELVSRLAVGQAALYLVGIGGVLYQHAQRVKTYYSSLEKVSLNWLRNLLAAMTLLWLAWASTWLMGPPSTSVFAQLISPLLFAAFVYVLGYKGLRQPELFTARTTLGPPVRGATTPPEPEAEAIPAKYEKSGLASDKMPEHVARLLTVMQEQQLFVNRDLTLQELADEVGITSNHLSQLLNEQLRKNFYEFGLG